MKKLILILLLSSFYTHAQYFEAKLLMVDGQIKEGLAKLPSNQLLDGNIEFKSSNKGELHKLSHENVSQILYTSKTGSQYLFENNNVLLLFKSFGKEYKKAKKNKHWMLLIHANSVLKEYSLAQRYKLDKKGRMTSITGGNSFWSSIYFLLKKPDEDEASIVSGIGLSNGMVRKAMAIYFKDNPEFVKRIENKEFKKSNVKDVADEYAKYYD
ncbi:MAG: hypothetical protein HKN54_05620 [Flavobacteriaceae bacterium]|nr:hypothetical protein [Flavobacteriaceae bacterium]